jgi:hypothetical protein
LLFKQSTTDNICASRPSLPPNEAPNAPTRAAEWITASPQQASDHLWQASTPPRACRAYSSPPRGSLGTRAHRRSAAPAPSPPPLSVRSAAPPDTPVIFCALICALPRDQHRHDPHPCALAPGSELSSTGLDRSERITTAFRPAFPDPAATWNAHRAAHAHPAAALPPLVPRGGSAPLFAPPAHSAGSVFASLDAPTHAFLPALPHYALPASARLPPHPSHAYSGTARAPPSPPRRARGPRRGAPARSHAPKPGSERAAPRQPPCPAQ